MSKLWQPTEYGPRGMEIQWMNNIVTTHSLFCSCEKPWDHLNDILSQQKIRCQFIGETATTTGADGDLDAFIEGDLEKLFEGDLTEDTG